MLQGGGFDSGLGIGGPCALRLYVIELRFVKFVPFYVLRLVRMGSEEPVCSSFRWIWILERVCWRE